MHPFEPLPDDDRQPFGAIFDCPEWIDTVSWSLRRDQDARPGHRFFLEHYLAPVAAVIADRLRSAGRVRVVDFGGGVGNLFVPIVGGLPRPDAVNYMIVELPSNVRRGEELFAGHPVKPRFVETLDEAPTTDVLIASSVIQYIEDYGAILDRLFAFGADVVYLTRLLCTEGASFAMRQNLTLSYGPHAGTYIGWTPSWFIDRNEVHRRAEAAGYARLLDVFFSDYSGLLAGTPQEGIDCTLRTMMFGRTGSRG